MTREFRKIANLDFKGKHAVVVLNVAYTGLGIIRSLKNENIQLIGLGYKKTSGSYSRHATFLLSPDSKKDKKELADFLIRLSEMIGENPLIIPTRDHDIMFLAQYRELLSPRYHLMLPDKACLDLVMSKWGLHKAAPKSGIKVPETIIINSLEELEDCKSSILYPCIIKPVYASDWKKYPEIWKACGEEKAVKINSFFQLEKRYSAIAKFQPRLLIQQYIPGSDEQLYTFCSYTDEKSNVLGYFVAHKILQEPQETGTGVVVNNIENKDIINISRRLLKQIKFTGISEIEYKYDSKTNKYYLIEINPRFWDQHRIGEKIGVNLAKTAFMHKIFNTKLITSPNKQFYSWIADDVFIMFLVKTLVKKPRDIFSIFQKLNKKIIFGLMDVRDPVPGILFYLGLISELSGRLLKRLLH